MLYLAREFDLLGVRLWLIGLKQEEAQSAREEKSKDGNFSLSLSPFLLCSSVRLRLLRVQLRVARAAPASASPPIRPNVSQTLPNCSEDHPNEKTKKKKNT